MSTKSKKAGSRVSVIPQVEGALLFFQYCFIIGSVFGVVNSLYLFGLVVKSPTIVTIGLLSSSVIMTLFLATIVACMVKRKKMTKAIVFAFLCVYFCQSVIFSFISSDRHTYVEILPQVAVAAAPCIVTASYFKISKRVKQTLVF